MYPGGCCYMLLLHVYTLADFLGFVDVLFQIIAFEYIVFYGGPFHFMCVWRRGKFRGLFRIYAKRIYVRRELFFGGKGTKVRGPIGTSNVPSRGVCQVWFYA